MVYLCIVLIDFQDRWKYFCGNKIMYVHSLGNCRQFLESMQSFNNIGWHNWSNSHHLHYSDFCWRCFTISTWWQNDAAIFRMHLLVSATTTNNCLWIEYFYSELQCFWGISPFSPCLLPWLALMPYVCLNWAGLL